jgi:hypothetical protein
VSPATTTLPTTATTVPTTPVDRSTVVWPFAGSSVRHTDPVEAARAFATTYLRFDAPVVGAFQRGDTRSGEVDVRPTRTGPVTTVIVRQMTADDTWFVLGAATANIEFHEPRGRHRGRVAGSRHGSGAHVRGQRRRRGP